MVPGHEHRPSKKFLARKSKFASYSKALARTAQLKPWLLRTKFRSKARCELHAIQRRDEERIAAVDIGWKTSVTVLIGSRGPVEQVHRYASAKMDAGGLARGDHVRKLAHRRLRIAADGQRGKRSDLLHAHAAVAQRARLAPERSLRRGIVQIDAEI